MRLFVAIRPDEKILNKIMWIANGFDGCRWIRRKNVHLTLVFIGEYPDDKIGDIKDALGNIKIKSFPVKLKRCGVFPNAGRARVLWVGVEQSRALMQLQQNVVNVLSDIGVDCGERQYTPHITVGRMRRRFKRRDVENWLCKHRRFECPPFDVASFELYQSILTPGGPVYKSIMNYGGISRE